MKQSPSVNREKKFQKQSRYTPESVALEKQTKVEPLNEVSEESREWFPGCQMIKVFQKGGRKQLWQMMQRNRGR